MAITRDRGKLQRSVLQGCFARNNDNDNDKVVVMVYHSPPPLTILLIDILIEYNLKANINRGERRWLWR